MLRFEVSILLNSAEKQSFNVGVLRHFLEAKCALAQTCLVDKKGKLGITGRVLLIGSRVLLTCE